MRQYLELIKTILETGTRKSSRTGIDTLSCFSLNFRHDLADGFPLLTTKKMDGKIFRGIVAELLWFISGEKHIRNLKKYTSIWDAWSDINGDLVTSYGFYWTKFPTVWNGKMVDVKNDTMVLHDLEAGNAEIGNFNQLKWIIDELKTNPNSRRLVCSAWEPENAHKSILPPCHFAWVVNVQDGRLCLQWMQRAVDGGLGLCWNIASYALLAHLLSKECNLKPGILSGCLIDAHIYVADEEDKTPIVFNRLTGETAPRCEFDHLKMLKEQLTREPYPLPKIGIANKPFFEIGIDDIELLNYQSHGPLRARVAV